MNKYGKKYFADIFHYVWIGFISGAISHWFFSWTRSFIMVIIGLVLFFIWEILQKEENTQTDYTKFIIVWVAYSLAIGMVNGGFQHFLDSPERSLWIIPLWFLISIGIFHLKENISFQEMKPNIVLLLVFGGTLSAILLIAYFLLPESVYLELQPHDH